MGDEDYVAEKIDDSALDPARLEAIKGRQSAVSSLMGRRSFNDALKAALENPPLASKNPDVKVYMHLSLFVTYPFHIRCNVI